MLRTIKYFRLLLTKMESRDILMSTSYQRQDHSTTLSFANGSRLTSTRTTVESHMTLLLAERIRISSTFWEELKLRQSRNQVKVEQRQLLSQQPDQPQRPLRLQHLLEHLLVSQDQLVEDQTLPVLARSRN